MYAEQDPAIFNPAFVRTVWAKRRRLALPKPVKPTIGALLKQFKKTQRAEKRRERRLQRELENRFKEVRVRKEIELEGHPSVKEIIAEVAKKRGVSVHAILGSDRFRWLVAIRHEAIVLAATLRPDLSLPVLGKAFGGKDHTTILHALRKAGVVRPGRSPSLQSIGGER